MNCEKIRQILTEDAGAGLASEVRSHLEACERCRRLHQDLLNLEELSGLLKGKVSAPPDFAARVLRRSVGQPNWRYGFLSGAAASLLILVAALVGWEHARNEVQPEVAPGMIQSLVQEPERIVLSPFAAEDTIGVQENGLLPDDYIDVLLRSASGSEYRVRVPSTIRIRQSDLHHDLYVTDVSY
jgi:hypothetical protein